MLTPLSPAPVRDERLHEAARQLEALLLKQIVATSGTFQGGQTAGSAVRAGLFADALAEALEGGGGIGLAAQIEQSLRGVAAAPAPVPAPGPADPAPASPGRVTSGFGLRADPFNGRTTQHNGIDLAATEGSPIHAAAGGVVKSAGPRGGYGIALEIDHGNGVSTLYGHASEALVHPGDQVAPGQLVGRVGHTGRATGPHLHFEVRVGGRPVDPTRALKSYAMRADGILERGP